MANLDIVRSLCQFFALPHCLCIREIIIVTVDAIDLSVHLHSKWR